FKSHLNGHSTASLTQTIVLGRCFAPSYHDKSIGMGSGRLVSSNNVDVQSFNKLLRSATLANAESGASGNRRPDGTLIKFVWIKPEPLVKRKWHSPLQTTLIQEDIHNCVLDTRCISEPIP
ncbi:hypothetical protein A0J61_11181, partial [Choanephora cucurbitarum]